MNRWMEGGGPRVARWGVTRVDGLGLDKAYTNHPRYLASILVER